MVQDVSQQIRVYKPNQRRELGVLQTWGIMARNMVSARELIWELFKRDLLAGYKKSFLGFAWLFISPILGIISWVFLQRAGVLQTGDVGIPYPAFVLIGSTMWGLFMGFYEAAQNTLNSAKTLVMQVNFPREALLVKQLAQYLANFSIMLLVTLIVVAAFGVFPAWQIVLFPLVVLPLFLLAAALGLVASMIFVVAVDLSKLASMLLGLAMWATPIIYSVEEADPLLKAVIQWNPLTYLVCSARDIIIYGRLYDNDATGYFICAGLSLVLFLFSWRLFYVSEDRIIERMI